MPFLTGRVSYTRFACDSHAPEFDELHIEALESRMAGATGDVPGTSPRASCGWSAGDHVLDREFTLLKNVYPERLLFDLCDITERAPPELLRAYYAVELKALAASNPSGYPSARQKREAKEAARDRLDQEAKDGRFLKRKCIPVLWDAKTRTVYFGSTSSGAIEKFWHLFEKTFGAKLTPVTAGRLCGPTGNDADFQPRPSPFVPGLDAHDIAWSPDTTTPDWLGNEFILWLWWHAEKVNDTIELPCGDVTYFFSGGGKLECPRGMTGTDTLNHDSFVRMREARAGIRSGKLPRQVALTLVCRGSQFSLKLQPEQMSVTGCKLPESDADITNLRERQIARMDSVRDLTLLLDQLYASFLEERRPRIRWGDRLRQIQAWVSADPRDAA